MTRLFWSIFSAIMLTVALVAGVATYAYNRYFDPWQALEARLDTHGASLAQLWQQQPDQVDVAVQRLVRHFGMRLTFIAPDGQEFGEAAPLSVYRLMLGIRSNNAIPPGAVVTLRRGLINAGAIRVDLDAGPAVLAGHWRIGETPNTGWGMEPFAIIAGVMLACLWAAWRIARPIRALSRSVAEFGAGQLNARPTLALRNRKDAIGDLARQLYSMSERITGLINAQRQLLRDVSHELRTPLSRVHIALGLVEQRAPQAQEQIQRIERDLGEFDELIGKVLELAKANSALDTAPERHVFALDELLTQVLDDARFEFAPRIVHSELQALMALGDADAIGRAVENVLRNALKYSPEDSPVALTLQRTQNWAQIRITDQGPGVQEEELDKIFDPFYRADDSRQRNSGGFGVGLAISYSIVSHHGGQIRARPGPNASGLEVEILLPLQ